MKASNLAAPRTAGDAVFIPGHDPIEGPYGSKGTLPLFLFWLICTLAVSIPLMCLYWGVQP